MNNDKQKKERYQKNKKKNTNKKSNEQNIKRLDGYILESCFIYLYDIIDVFPAKRAFISMFYGFIGAI